MLILSVLVALFMGVTVSAQPLVQAPAAVVLDADSGQVLVAKNIHERRAPASLTKILTSLLVLNQASGHETVTVSRTAASTGGASVGLRTGEHVDLQVLLGAMFLRSGNDGATALAEHVGGSVSGFARMMNVHAQLLGMTNSHFVNAHGLDATNHYSTAYDLAVLTRQALQNPAFAALAQNNYTRVRWNGEIRHIWNINSFLWRYDGATGVKTGYTSNAGYCLAASARQGDRTLILVLLGAHTSNQRWLEAIRLLDFAFANHTRLHQSPAMASTNLVHVVRPGETLSHIARWYQTSVTVLAELNELSNPNRIRSGQVLLIPQT